MLQTRQATIGATTAAGERVRRATIATENAVDMFDWHTGRSVLEVLLVDGCRLAEPNVHARVG